MLWKAIDTDSEYEVSDTGLIRKVHYMKTNFDRDGYERVNITNNDKRYNVGLHRLILHAFDPRPNEKELEVHHIDGNPKNNNLDNLMWVTHEENIKFIENEEKIYKGQFIAKKIAQYDLNNNLIQIYESAYQAGKKTGLNHRHISEVCRGKRKTTGGFKWAYLEGSTTNCSDKYHETGDSIEQIDEDIV